MSETPTGNGSVTNAALAARIDRMELRQERMELTQVHNEELNRIRFESLGQSVTTIGGKLDAFMARIEGIITGDVETNQARQGAELIADYRKWRDSVDADREEFDHFKTQVTTLTRLVIVAGGGWIVTGIALWRTLQP